MKLKNRLWQFWSPRCTSVRNCQFKLLLPTILMLAVVALLGFLVIFQFTIRQNRQAENDSRHLVRAILQERQLGLEGVVLDFAGWNDFYRRAFESQDLEWIRGHVWSYFRDGHAISMVSVLDPDNARMALFSVADDGEKSWQDIEAMALGMADRARSGADGEAVSAFYQTGDVTGLMTVAPIVPRQDGAARDRAGILVVVRPLTDGDVSDIATLYGIERLHLASSPAPKGSGSISIRLASGESGRSYLQWQAPHPGRETLWILLPGLFVLIILFFFMAQHMLHVWLETVGLARGRENELNAVFSAAADAILIVGSDGRVLRANASAESLFGLDFMQTPEGVRVDEVLKVHIGGGGISSLWSFLRLASDRSAVSGVEALGVRGGETFPAEISAGLARLQRGEGMVLMARDITGRKRAEAEILEGRRLAEAASQAKSAFLANMSHEFRTPLNAMIGFSEIIREQMFGLVGSEKYRDYAADIHSSARRLLHIIQNILELSELESGNVPLREDMFTPRQVVEEVVASLADLAKDRQVSVVVEGEGPRMLVADRIKFEGIVSNLLDNAIRYTPGGRFAKIRLAEEGTDFFLFVEDAGSGLDEQTRTYLFEPFFRSAHTYSQRHGAGLGLPICRKYAELMGGEISLEWTSENGTCFRLRLPAGHVPGFFPETPAS